MATSDSYGQTRVFVRDQYGTGPSTQAELAASGGTVTVKAGGVLAVSGQFTANAGSSMAVSGNLVLGAGSTLQASGQISFGAGSTVQASGQINFGAGSSFQASGGITFGPGSTFKASGSIVFGQGSTFDSSGGVNLGANSTLTGLGKIVLTDANVLFPGSLAKGYIDLGPHLFAARVAASGETVASGSTAPTAFFGGLLMPDGAPALKFDSTANKRLSLNYASAIVAALVLPPIAMPADFATAGGLTLEMYGETVGTATAADAIQAFTWEARFSALTSASTPANVGTTSPNFTTSPTWKGITIASGDVATDQLSVIITPQAHAGRAINIFGMRGSYTKKTS